ncbi:MAG: phosphomannomutase/phosphoglucomutase [Candidatus Latescibacterota bacterium]|nr:MAG: phosphomannomutase/phosphoglucomutase [Candidatus Latescibacterota bacterium]
MNAHMFREYDIRGIAGTDLDADGVTKLGRAFGTLYRGEHLRRIVVARDVRLSSEEYANALIEGLRACGCDVVDVGMVPTPVMYYAVETLQADGGVMVTASHNPPEFNGFKSRTRERALFGADIQRIWEIAQRGDYAQGRGDLERLEVLDAYLDHIARDVRLERPLHVAIDCGNGTAGVVAPRLLERLGCRVEGLYCEPDGRFPNHVADPTVPEYVEDLMQKVRTSGAEIGIGFDGDADRVGVVDEGGRLLFGDELLILYARSLLAARPGPVVFDVKCSQALVDEVRRLGGKPEMWRTGYPHIQSRMRETGAQLAGEMSGHMYFADRYFGYDDGIYAACRTLEILASAETPLSSRLADVPRYVSTPEIRVPSSDEEKFGIVEDIAAHFRAEYETIDVDGVRILFPGGWGLVRASNTQPILVVRFEGDSQDTLERIQETVRAKLREYDSVEVNF